MISTNLKRYREKKKLTQQALAATLSVTRQAVSSWECGRTQPDLNALHAIAAALDVPVNTLIRKENQFLAPSKQPLTDDIVNAFNCMLSQTWTRFSENPDLDAVFALHTVKGNTYYQDITWESGSWTPGDFRGEELCIHQLNDYNDTQVRCIIVSFKGHGVLPQPDSISWYFAQRLLELDVRNLDALVLLWGGGNIYRPKPVHTIAPPNIVRRFLG